MSSRLARSQGIRRMRINPGHPQRPAGGRWSQFIPSIHQDHRAPNRTTLQPCPAIDLRNTVSTTLSQFARDRCIVGSREADRREVGRVRNQDVDNGKTKEAEGSDGSTTSQRENITKNSIPRRGGARNPIVPQNADDSDTPS